MGTTRQGGRRFSGGATALTAAARFACAGAAVLGAACVVAGLVGAGCASARDRATWADVDAPGTAAGGAPAGASARPWGRGVAQTGDGKGAVSGGAGSRVDEGSDVPLTGGASAGIAIDRALQKFVDARARSRHVEKESVVWGDAWDLVILSIADACITPPKASDLGAFVRARVTLEVELAKDQERGVNLPAELDKRVHAVLGAVDESVGELRAANAPGTFAPSPRLGDGELIVRAPLGLMVVSSPFGVRTDPFTGQKRYHNGVDLDARLGDSVFAAASGLVVYAGLQGGYGKQVVLDHGDGVRTHYSHLSQILVETGQTVAEGDAIALVGSTGRSTGPHLHFAVTNGEEFLDPLAVVDIPFSSIASQVKVGTEKEKRAFALKKVGDSVEITAAP